MNIQTPLVRGIFVTLILLGAALPAPCGFELQSAGQVVVHSKPGAYHTTSSTSWTDLPGMRGAVTLPKGGDLAIALTVEGRAFGSSRPVVYVRALVDNQAVPPTVVKLFVNDPGIRTTTASFFKAGLTAGPHRVRLQWSVATGSQAAAYSRTLVLRFAESGSPHMRLFHVQGSSLSRRAGGWLDIPGLAAGVACPWDASVTINVAGEFASLAAGKRIFIRALIDSLPSRPSDLVVATGDSEGTRAFTFSALTQKKGNHPVRIQWYADADSLVLFPTLTVTVVPAGINTQTGSLNLTPASGPLVSTGSSTFTTVPSAGGNLYVPARGDVTVRFCAETYLSTKGSSLMLRAFVDSRLSAPGELRFGTGDGSGTYQSRECVFVFRNIPRGWRKLRLEWRVIGGGAAYLGDRTFAATAVVGQWPLLMTGMESTRPKGYKYGGTFASSVIDVRNNVRYFKPYVGDALFRVAHGVAAYFQEVSLGQAYLVEAAVIGPNLKKYDEKYYRENIKPAFTTMKIEALQKADATFDYSYYDRNGDGVVRTDELYPMVVLYQDYTFGEVRDDVKGVSTNDGVTLDYSSGLATIYTPDFKTGTELGLIAHELCHLIIDAGDEYPEENQPRLPDDPGPYSLMDWHAYFAHLDPLHKMKAGNWIDPVTVAKDGYTIMTGVAQGGRVYQLRDPASHAGEYFLVEYRKKTGFFDGRLPSDGLALWHCDEKRLKDWRTAIEIEPAGGQTNWFKYETYLFTGTQPGFHLANDVHDDSSHANTRWHDQTKSRIGIWGIRKQADGTMKAFLDVPGPGVLIQFDRLDYPMNPDGWATLIARIVNTDVTPATFRLSLQMDGAVKGLPSSVNLGGYQQRILAFRVKPTTARFRSPATLKAQGTGTNVTCSDTTQVRYTLLASGPMTPGSTVTLRCEYPENAGHGYLMGASFGFSPGIPIQGLGTLALNPDILFFIVPFLPTVFQNFTGQLDAKGNATAYVHVPGDPKLVGVRFYCAYVTAQRLASGISNLVIIQIR